MVEWIPLERDGKKGVRYREHPTRKYGILPDRYYTINYWWNKKTHTEAVGWASEKITETICFDLLRELKHNQKTGEGPCTFAEKRELAKREKAAERKRQDEIKQNTFKAFFENVFLPRAKTRWKPETAVKAVQHVEKWIHPVTKDTPFGELNISHADKILANMHEAGRSPRMMQYVFRTFSMVWNAARDRELVSGRCPTKMDTFRLPKIDNAKERYLTVDEEKRLLKCVRARSQQAHDMAVVSIDAGLRFGEIAALTFGCIDLENGAINVLNTKTGSDRIVPMTTRLRKLFKSMAPGEPNALVFPKGDGQIHKEALGAFRTGVKNAKLNENINDKKMLASFHTLRHTYASRLVQAGVDLLRVSRLLGHSTPVITARYSKLANADLREAVQAMEQNTKAAKANNGKVIQLKKKA